MAKQKPLLRISQPKARRKSPAQMIAIRVNEFMRLLFTAREEAARFAPATATDDEVERFVAGAQRIWHQARYYQRFLFIGDKTSQTVAAAIKQTYGTEL